MGHGERISAPMSYITCSVAGYQILRSQTARPPGSQARQPGIRRANMLIFHCFIRKTRFRDKKYQYFVGFKRFSEKYVAVAAAAWVGLAPHCSHSITFFENVDISKVLATFFVGAETRRQKNLRPAFNPPEPHSSLRYLFGEYQKKSGQWNKNRN